MRQDVEVAGGAVGGVQRLVHPGPERRGERDLEGDDEDERAAVAAESPPGDGRDSAQAQRRCHPSRPLVAQSGGGIGPGGERLAMHARPHVRAGQRQALAQIQGRCELGDRLASRPNLRRRGRAGEPCGERLFSGAGSRDREQLEERAAAKQVKVVGVEVMIVHESVAGLACPRPPILETGYAALVEENRARGEIALANNRVVALHEPAEHHDRHRQPRVRQGAAPAEKSEQQQYAKDAEAQIAQAGVARGQRLVSRAALAEPFPILRRRVGNALSDLTHVTRGSL